jgi:hypothetical protein
MKAYLRRLAHLVFPGTVMFAASCAPTTPAARIEKFPARFEAMPPTDRDAVSKGQLKEGMSQDAVFFLWGEPGRVLRGVADNKPFEEWIYTRSEPVYSQQFFYGWGPGYGFCNDYPHSSWGTSIDYIRVPDRVVRFEGGRVTAWKMRR